MENDTTTCHNCKGSGTHRDGRDCGHCAGVGLLADPDPEQNSW
jgi:DnaJ-class molecular chaperone